MISREAVIKINVEEFISAGFKGEADELISLLQLTQKIEGFISPQSGEIIARFLGISEAQVYAVASFYSQFRFHKPGKIHMRVCVGTACHVQGSHELSQEVQDGLKIHSGETTPDGRFDFGEVACLGCCAQAAVVEVNGVILAKMTRDKLRGVLEEYELAR